MLDSGKLVNGKDVRENHSQPDWPSLLCLLTLQEGLRVGQSLGLAFVEIDAKTNLDAVRGHPRFHPRDLSEHPTGTIGSRKLTQSGAGATPNKHLR
jgi:hypothetical protein